jgi:hypothetical protein
MRVLKVCIRDKQRLFYGYLPYSINHMTKLYYAVSCLAIIQSPSSPSFMHPRDIFRKTPPNPHTRIMHPLSAIPKHNTAPMPHLYRISRSHDMQRPP